MKKLMNYRPIFVMFLTATLATLISVFVAKTSESKLICAIIIAAIFVFFAIFHAFFIKNCKILHFLFLLVVVLTFVSTWRTQTNLVQLSKYSGEQVQVSGVVCENYKRKSENQIIFQISDVEIDGAKISGKLTVFLNPRNFDISKIEVGAVARINSKVNFYDINDDNSKLSYISSGYVGSLNILSHQLEITQSENLSLRDKIKNSVHEKLEDVDYGEIGYAMLFGDSSGLSAIEKDTFRSTGIAHLLAVSGLHVSIIALAIMFILKKLKTPRVAQLVLLSIALIFYCYLCDFSISVIRASFMALFAVYATLKGKPYDNLTVLSFIGLIILLLNPFELFNLSFILSFTAVLSIILLIEPLTRLFDKVFYKRLASLLALNVSVQIGLFAVQVYYFARFPIFGILANLVSVPIASISFVCLFVLAIFSFILPATSLINLSFGAPMSQIMKFNYWISYNSPVLVLNNLSVFVIAVALMLVFVLSDYVFLKRKTKLVIGSSILVIMLALIISGI